MDNACWEVHGKKGKRKGVADSLDVSLHMPLSHT